MLQASRIAIIGLLALMQLFAPLVHAHTGGGVLPGSVHLPGLEFLAQSGGNFAQPPAGQDEYRDVIVVPAPGLKNHDDRGIPAADPEFALPILWSLLTGLCGGVLVSKPPADFLSLATAWLQPSPRAPPRFG